MSAIGAEDYPLEYKKVPLEYARNVIYLGPEFFKNLVINPSVFVKDLKGLLPSVRSKKK